MKKYVWLVPGETLDSGKKEPIRSGDPFEESLFSKETIASLLKKKKIKPADGSIVVQAELSAETKEQLADLGEKVEKAVALNAELEQKVIALTEQLASVTEERDLWKEKFELIKSDDLESIKDEPKEPAKDEPKEPTKDAKGKKVEY